ncbi:MAG: lytic transglycosylase domain-containing protein [Stellaceae bacterium]
MDPPPILAAVFARHTGLRPAIVGAAAVLSLIAAGSRGASAGSLVSGPVGALDQIAFAVDGAESSHGADPNMWRVEPDGPQGPMQVSAAAALDVGGGDRFDTVENRMLGRAYLAQMYRRYANWPDAVAAYNWGPGNMDAWIGAGRPVERLPIAVSLYRIRVLFGSAAPLGGRAMARLGMSRSPRRSLADRRHPSRESVAVEQLYDVIIAESERAIR